MGIQINFGYLKGCIDMDQLMEERIWHMVLFNCVAIIFIFLIKPIFIGFQYFSMKRAISLLANYHDDYTDKQKNSIAGGMAIARDLWLSRGNNVCQALGTACDRIGRSVLGISEAPITAEPKLLSELNYWKWAFSGGFFNAIDAMNRARLFP